MTFKADDCYVLHKWRKERLWIERINAEEKGRKDWDENWAFLADYDQKVNSHCFIYFFLTKCSTKNMLNKGNLKEKKVLPERVNMYTETIPSSCGHDYGFRLNTNTGLHMQNLQNKFNAEHKLRRNEDAFFDF